MCEWYCITVLRKTWVAAPTFVGSLQHAPVMAMFKYKNNWPERFRQTSHCKNIEGLSPGWGALAKTAILTCLDTKHSSRYVATSPFNLSKSRTTASILAMLNYRHHVESLIHWVQAYFFEYFLHRKSLRLAFLLLVSLNPVRARKGIWLKDLVSRKWGHSTGQPKC